MEVNHDARNQYSISLQRACRKGEKLAILILAPDLLENLLTEN